MFMVIFFDTDFQNMISSIFSEIHSLIVVTLINLGDGGRSGRGLRVILF